MFSYMSEGTRVIGDRDKDRDEDKNIKHGFNKNWKHEGPQVDPPPQINEHNDSINIKKRQTLNKNGHENLGKGKNIRPPLME